MMRTLLKSCAGAAMAAAGPAIAFPEVPELRWRSGGFDVQLHAGVSGQVAFFDEEGRDTDSPEANYDLYARLNAQWTSPGGVLIGASLETDNSDRETESLDTGEVYGFLASDFGRFEVGKQDGAADVLAFHAPVIALGQIRGDFSRYAGAQALLSPLDTSDATKVTYYSPPIAGLRAGISYAPRFKRNQDAPDPTDRTIVRDNIELGLQYQVPVGDWVLGASGSYVHGNADPDTTRADLDSWSIGTEARRGPLRIGAAYVDRGDSNRLSRDFDQWEINGGAGWIEDEWGIAFSAARTESSIETRRAAGVGGFYRLTRNIQVRADLVGFDEKAPTEARRDGVVALVELALSF